MPLLTGVVRVEDTSGQRVDPADSQGNFNPIVLQLDPTFSAVATPNGATTTVRLSAIGAGGGGVISFANFAAFRAVASAALSSGQVVHFQSPIGDWVYYTDRGAGEADDGIPNGDAFGTILKPTDVTLGANGRLYSLNAPVLPTIAALRLAKSGVQSTIHVQSYSTPGDQGGDVFHKRTGSGTDNGGTVIVPTGVTTFYYERQYSGPLDVRWFGAKGDDVDDRAAIINALAAVPTSGGGLRFSRGVYKLSNEITVTGYTNLTIVGDGNARLHLTKDKKAFLVTSCTNLRISGLHIDGTIQVDGGDSGGGNINQTAIHLTNCTGVEIDKNKISNVGGYGVFISTGNASIDVHHNRFDQTMAGVQTAGAAGTVNNRDLRITHNTFIGFIPTGGAGTLGSDDQIAVFDGPTIGVVIAKNFIDKRGVDAGSKAKIQARCIDIAVGSGSYLQDVLIEGNTCVNCYSTSNTLDRPAIDIGGSAAGSTLSGITVRDNTVRTANAGIVVQFGTGATLINCDIHKNKVYDIQHAAGGTLGWGIAINNVANGSTLFARVSVEGNTIDTVANTAIYGSFFSYQVKIRDNKIISPGARGIDLGALGTDCEIVGNQVFSAGTYGIVAQNNTRSLLISRNIVRTTANDAYYILGQVDCVVSGNIARSAGGNGFYAQSNTGIVLEANEASGCTSHGLISLVLNSDLRLIGNRFHDNSGYGVQYQDTNGTVFCASNMLTGNVSGEFHDASVTSTVRFHDVPTSRQIVAGAGLTGGGDLSADRTVNIVAADSTITVNADSIQVGTVPIGQVSGGVPSTRTLTGTTPITVDGDNAAHDLSANRTIAVASATTTATGVVKLAQDLAGTALLPTVIGLTGTAGTVAVHSTNLTWDGGGPTVASLAGTGLLLKSGAGTIQYQDGANIIGGLNWNGGSTYYDVGASASEYLLYAHATSQRIRIKVAGTTPVGIELAADTIKVSKGDDTVKGVWTNTGLRVGDGTLPAAAFEVKNGITVSASAYLQNETNLYQFSAAAVSGTGGKITMAVAVAADGDTLILEGQTAGASNKNGGPILMNGGRPTGTGLPGAISMVLKDNAGGASYMCEIKSLGTSGTTRRVVALANVSAIASTDLPDGDGVVWVGTATTVPVTKPGTGFALYGKAGRPTFWGSNTGAVEVSWENNVSATAASGALTPPALVTEYLTLFVNGNARKLPLYS